MSDNLVRIKKLSLITTDITINEIAKHFAAHDVKSIGISFTPHVRKLIKDISGSELPELTKAEIEDKIWGKNLEATEAMLGELQANILSVDVVRPSEVMKDYSTGRGMFADGGKKDQFPDAFILKAIEEDAKSNGPILIFSKDSDFKRAENAELRISVVDEIGDFLGKLDLKVSDQNIEVFLQAQNHVILERASTEIMDFFVHVADQSELEGEVLSVEATEITEIDEFNINDHETLLTGTMRVTADVGYSGPDMSTAIYDSEDKRAYAFHEIDGETTEDFLIKFTMTISNDNNGVPELVESMNFINDGPLYININDDYK